MFQYYLRDAGVSLSWVGSGRLLFSIDWTDAHFDDLLSRMLSACAAMDAGGWWVAPRVNVKKALGFEFVGAIVKFLKKWQKRPGPRPATVPTVEAELVPTLHRLLDFFRFFTQNLRMKTLLARKKISSSVVEIVNGAGG